MACSAAWDTSDIVVVGADETDMARCVNRIKDLQGGAVIANQGRALEEIALVFIGYHVRDVRKKSSQEESPPATEEMIQPEDIMETTQ